MALPYSSFTFIPLHGRFGITLRVKIRNLTHKVRFIVETKNLPRVIRPLSKVSFIHPSIHPSTNTRKKKFYKFFTMLYQVHAEASRLGFALP